MTTARREPKTTTPFEAQVTYEVWRTHAHGTGPLCVYRDIAPSDAPAVLASCLNDKADGRPDAPTDFYLVRVTAQRERVPPPPPLLSKVKAS